MKKLIQFLFILAFSNGCLRGQITQPPGVIIVSTAPSGACTAGVQGQMVTSTGAIWTCQSGTWATVGGGGGGSGCSLTTKGDLCGYSTTTARVPVGADGTVLTADSTASTGVSYKAAGGSLAFNWTFNNGSPATDASPRFLVAHAGTISNCYVLTTASDGSTALTLNIFQNGTSIFGGAQTVTAGTAAGTISTFASATTFANNDKMSINITSGTSSWVFSIQCK